MKLLSSQQTIEVRDYKNRKFLYEFSKKINNLYGSYLAHVQNLFNHEELVEIQLENEDKR
jgi:hypothetical protein